MAASAILGGSAYGNWGRLAAQQALTQDQLLQFDTFGNVSLIHITDIHAQLKPIYFREPSINIGVGGSWSDCQVALIRRRRNRACVAAPGYGRCPSPGRCRWY